MKNLLLLALIGVSSISFGQTLGKWSTGLSYTPSIQNGTTLAIPINRHFTDKFQMGLTVFTWYDKYQSGSSTNVKSGSLGINLTSKYVFVKGSVLRPYIQGFGGYGHTATIYQSQFYDDREELLDYWGFSLGIGTEVAIGKKGWFGDINLGYFKYISLSGATEFSSPIGSVGILKRFGK